MGGIIYLLVQWCYFTLAAIPFAMLMKLVLDIELDAGLVGCVTLLGAAAWGFLTGNLVIKSDHLDEAWYEE